MGDGGGGEGNGWVMVVAVKEGDGVLGLCSLKHRTSVMCLGWANS